MQIVEEAKQCSEELSASGGRAAFRIGFFVMVLNVLCSLAFVAGIFWVRVGEAAPPAASAKKEPRIIYPERTELDFEGAKIEGEIRNPGELYFQRRQEEQFGSLVQPRRHFRKEILRDLMQTR